MIQDGIFQIDPIYDLIKIINEHGHQVVGIEGEYFITTNFIPGDKTTPYHSIRGKHITKILVDFYRVGMQDFLRVQSIIENLPERDIQYSSEFKWVQYIS